jgi:hypothetical protein
MHSATQTGPVVDSIRDQAKLYRLEGLRNASGITSPGRNSGRASVGPLGWNETATTVEAQLDR